MNLLITQKIDANDFIKLGSKRYYIDGKRVTRAHYYDVAYAPGARLDAFRTITKGDTVYHRVCLRND